MPIALQLLFEAIAMVLFLFSAASSCRYHRAWEANCPGSEDPLSAAFREASGRFINQT
jgi:hypothetical protein